MLGDGAAYLDEEWAAPDEGPAWEGVPWRAWSDLTTDRPYVSTGMSVPMGGTIIQARPLPIPWSSIHAWCDRTRLEDDDRDFVVDIVRKMDREFIAHWAAQQNRPAAQSLDEKLRRFDAS